MSLADLKNKKGKLKTPKKISIDEFIEGADHYAKGRASPVKEKTRNQSDFKRATFTLTHQHIDMLNRLADKTGFAKSKLLRMMIEWCHDLEDPSSGTDK